MPLDGARASSQEKLITFGFSSLRCPPYGRKIHHSNVRYWPKYHRHRSLTLNVMKGFHSADCLVVILQESVVGMNQKCWPAFPAIHNRSTVLTCSERIAVKSKGPPCFAKAGQLIQSLAALEFEMRSKYRHFFH